MTRYLATMATLFCFTACDPTAVPPSPATNNPSVDGVDGSVHVDGTDGADAADGSVLADGVDASDGAFDGTVGLDGVATDGNNDGGVSTDASDGTDTTPVVDPNVCDFAPPEGTYWDLDQNFEQLDLTVEPTLEGCKITTINLIWSQTFVGSTFPLEEPAVMNSTVILDCQSPDHEAFTLSTIMEDGTEFSKHRFAMNP